jgi:hypothetical protein
MIEIQQRHGLKGTGHTHKAKRTDLRCKCG